MSAGGWAVLATLAGFLGTRHWLLDLTAHFRVQYVAFLAPLAALMLWRHRWIYAALFAAGAGLNILALLTLYLPPKINQAPPETALTVQTANLRCPEAKRDALVQYLLQCHADVLLLQEVDFPWLNRLLALHAHYPYRLEQAQGDNYGIALYSKRPLEQTRLVQLGGGWIPAIDTEIVVGPHRLHLLGVHLYPPVNAAASGLRNAMLHEIPALAPGHHRPTIVLGDLKTTKWSPYFRRTVLEAGLRDSARGFGVQPTWPAVMPWLFRIPLDHALVSHGLDVTRREIGPRTGSDHRPLLLEIRIAY